MTHGSCHVRVLHVAQVFWFDVGACGFLIISLKGFLFQIDIHDFGNFDAPTVIMGWDEVSFLGSYA